MLNGLDILIERMQTHPDEFVREGKWTDVLVAIDKHLTVEEKQALKQGFTDMSRSAFNEVVLKAIAGEGVEHSMIEIIYQDYDSIMSYPLEKQKRYEEEAKQRREMTEMMERDYKQRALLSQQGQAYGTSNSGSGLLGNQVHPWR